VLLTLTDHPFSSAVEFSSLVVVRTTTLPLRFDYKAGFWKQPLEDLAYCPLKPTVPYQRVSAAAPLPRPVITFVEDEGRRWEGKEIDDCQEDCHCHSDTLVPEQEKAPAFFQGGSESLVHQLSLYFGFLCPLNAIPSSCPISIAFSKSFPLRFCKFNIRYEILFRDVRMRSDFDVCRCYTANHAMIFNLQ
jgi:hypothetical protein